MIESPALVNKLTPLKLNTMRKKILNYYQCVDKMQFDKLKTIFSKDVYYCRSGYKIRGIKALLDFYDNIRTIRGKHKILEDYRDDDKNAIIVKGIFNGKNGKGEKVKITFVDIFRFDKDNLVNIRETYLANCYELTI